MFALSLLFTLLVPCLGIFTHPSVPKEKYIADVKNFPFFVALGGKGNCGGSVIAGSTDPKKAYIATAAHCFCNDDGEKMNGPMLVTYSNGKQVIIFDSAGLSLEWLTERCLIIPTTRC